MIRTIKFIIEECFFFLVYSCSILPNWVKANEPPHDKTNKVTCAPSEYSDQPGHPPSLIRVFAVHSVGSEGPKLSSCGQQRLGSDWADTQADLSLRWVHSHVVGFVMSRLK